MKWLWIILLTLVASLFAIVLIGWLLPKGHVATRSTVLRSSPEAVWKLIAGPPDWRPQVQSFEELPPHEGHRMWREVDRQNHRITFEAVESVESRRLVTRIADPNLPFGGDWTYEIVPAANGCSLTITENGEVYNPVFRFVSHFFMSNTATIDAYISALKNKLEE